jgi:peptidoglycan hydrolase CwlO-like protein
VKNSILRILANETVSKFIAGFMLFLTVSFLTFQYTLFVAIKDVQADVKGQQEQIDNTQKSLSDIKNDVREIRNYFLGNKQ